MKFKISGEIEAENEEEARFKATVEGGHGILDFEEVGLEKFECADCGCYFWVEDRNNFDCPNCEQKLNDETMKELTNETDEEYNQRLKKDEI